MSLRPCLTPSSMQYSDIYIPTHSLTSTSTLAVIPYPAF
uniref:Putative uncharacterized protein YLR466C-B n=2 Tax=Saccharomyces cerevisiae TaxID=4932 RepID=YL466_YEAST|nr:RecName: Full=Putative uncharacterized protein YLR466C-B [Saccharomyces cerevisiae S288C]AAL79324.1 unknown [Saccharomyces cerevisiae]